MSATAHHPAEWKTARLGDVVQITSGITLGRKLDGQHCRMVSYVRVANVKDGWLDLGEVKETPATEDEIRACRLEPGDILLTEGGDPDKLGRGTFWKGEVPECIHQNHIFRVHANPAEFDPAFLAFQFGSAYGKTYFLRHAKQTTGIASINKTVLSNFPLLIPPLAEQRNIAGRLQEQLAEVAQARDAVQAQLDAAEALPAAHLRAVFNSPAAHRWPKRKLGELLQLRKEVIHPRNNPRGPAVFVGLEHILSLTGQRTGSLPVEMTQLTGRKPRFYAGDIVYGYLRPYLNKVWVAEFDGLCSVDQYVYEVKRDKAETDFVAWFMRSPVYLARAPIGATPGQLPRIRTEEVASVEINLPPLSQQKAVMAQIQDEFTESNKLNESLLARLTALDRLPAALLRDAFAGRN